MPVRREEEFQSRRRLAGDEISMTEDEYGAK
jgi:hypothetical protein